MLQATRKRFTMHDIISYRREAERHVGSDENLYRFEWVRVPHWISTKFNVLPALGESGKKAKDTTDGEERL
jgi:hypothetical protein